MPATTSKKLLLISRVAPELQTVLQEEFPDWRIVDCNRDRDRVADEIRDAHVVYGRVKPEEFANAEKLEFIQVGVQGVENMLYSPLVNSTVKVANAKGLWSASVVEHTLALLFALQRNIPAAVRAQDRGEWGLGTVEHRLLRGATVGALGTGSIGRRLAEVLRTFGCILIGYNRSGAEHGLFEAVYSGDKLHGFLGSCDVVVNSLPLTDETAGFMNARAFAWMKSSAIYINVGRGKTDDETALIEALHGGRIAAAGLDVFAEEPLPAGHPLWTAPNLLITPHIAGVQDSWQQPVFDLLMENLRRYRDGESLINLVDKQRGY